MRPLVLAAFVTTVAFTVAAAAPAPKPAPTAPAPTAPAPAPAPAPGADLRSIPLPDAGADGVMLDYLAIDRARGRVWVPAGGTANVVVIDTKSGAVHPVGGFPTAEVERRGTKRKVGPSSATVGDGVVYVGNRADSNVCAVEAESLAKAGCVTLPSSPDGVAYVARAKQVWVTTPRDQSIVMLDAAAPKAPKVAGSLKLEGDPEGYAVDDAHGVFYTNLEDKDRTLRIDVASRKVTATWNPECGENGPRGLAVDPSGRWLVVACTDHVEVLDTAGDGKIASKLATGEGVDNIDLVPSSRMLYAAAGRAGTLTVASLGTDGALTQAATMPTAEGARNAVATDDGTAYVAAGRDGKIIVVATKKGR